MDAKQFSRWLDDYGAAWIDGDPDAVTELFADDARYYETPFDEPFAGLDEIRRYWQEGAEQGQRDITFSCEVIAVADKSGFARWGATFVRVPSGRFVELEGVLQAEFDDDGKCVTFREWWHRRESS